MASTADSAQVHKELLEALDRFYVLLQILQGLSVVEFYNWANKTKNSRLLGQGIARGNGLGPGVVEKALTELEDEQLRSDEQLLAALGDGASMDFLKLLGVTGSQTKLAEMGITSCHNADAKESEVALRKCGILIRRLQEEKIDFKVWADNIRDWSQLNVGKILDGRFDLAVAEMEMVELDRKRKGLVAEFENKRIDRAMLVRAISITFSEFLMALGHTEEPDWFYNQEILADDAGCYLSPAESKDDNYISADPGNNLGFIDGYCTRSSASGQSPTRCENLHQRGQPSPEPEIMERKGVSDDYMANRIPQTPETTVDKILIDYWTDHEIIEWPEGSGRRYILCCELHNFRLGCDVNRGRVGDALASASRHFHEKHESAWCGDLYYVISEMGTLVKGCTREQQDLNNYVFRQGVTNYQLPPIHDENYANSSTLGTTRDSISLPSIADIKGLTNKYVKTDATSSFPNTSGVDSTFMMVSNFKR